MIVRIGLGVSAYGAKSGSTQAPVSFLNTGDERDSGAFARTWLPKVLQRNYNESPNFAMHPLNVNVTTVEQNDAMPHYAK